jgi:hypothetical protein
MRANGQFGRPPKGKPDLPPPKQVMEIVLHVALNTWTNYINEVAKTDIDFPVVTARASQ